MAVSTNNDPTEISGSQTKSLVFVMVSLAMFYALVYGLPVDGIVLPFIRSSALTIYAISLIYLQNRLALFRLTLIEKRLSALSISLWGIACFVINLVLIGGVSYLFLRGLVDKANHGFDIQRFNSKPIAIKAFMAFSAALSEEVIYRRVLLRYLLGVSLRLPMHVSLSFAIVMSSLVFGFGHFHAGFEKCLITSVLGVVFAGFYIRKRNIWVVVIGHFLEDAFAFIV